MRYLIGIICVVFMALAGCASVHYTSPIGETFSYNRLGLMNIEGFEMTKPDGTSVRFNKSTGGERILDALTNASQTALNLSRAVPK